MSKANKNSDPASTEKENNNKKVRGIVSEITKSTGDAILKPEKIKESDYIQEQKNEMQKPELGLYRIKKYNFSKVKIK